MACNAISRLDVLSKQLTAEDEQRPAPGGGPGSLTLTDNRTGKKYELEISVGGTINAQSLKQIKAGGDGVGLRAYDPGYTNTTAVISRISYIDGDKGILRYRGYPIEEIAERSNMLETAYLVLFGNLPSQPQLAHFRENVMRHSALPIEVTNAVNALPHDAHPMGALMTGICALSTLHPEANPAIAGQGVYKHRDMQDKQIVRLLAKVPTLAALAYHKCTGRTAAPPNQSLDYSENFLYMLDGGNSPNYRPNPKLARALDIMFILHAEHEMNCSTAAVRHLASSGVDVYTAVAGAVGALYGPLHGGANEAVLRMLARIGSVENIPKFLEGVKNKKEKLFGFGHRVYRNFDPRAKIIKGVAEEVFTLVGRDPLIEIAVTLQDAALADEYFVSRKLYPNVDFYSGLVYRAMGFPPQFFTVLFAIPRIVGYCAHWRESLVDPDTKIIRPQQDYRGVWLRHYEAVVFRHEAEGGDNLVKLPPSNAYRRRIAGEHWQ
uniref:Citrate synthase n=1 Tax=Polytomella parva TaxID=51329 RepID=A0A7S0VEM7_9CHLO|mmetsp:Transcript_33628/g.60720  ORF Transcript_33628/g.60720 Transcript_33628/m.60720 type:complete len:492 (+) Transcript_33628:39-1514(+)|eukprot:CAMPEP_0175061258 /NCGR_PEP_ID=MMETSP0052_2-20121109/13484_1 /TAXON_ID=51329 ORGANISM="Polytomella parva, Strain SAG 63-3" /NCGR_SAMPLE_ID=MMETSP0052_2 /ASSEMBLY_ACC=CAM_ASM_000194 /LENGTH=491 /DNA_ID=CAMNT_0016327091 /DNA_START=21 /DNA_END=1496 /DNA_ORIENTATION=+